MWTLCTLSRALVCSFLLVFWAFGGAARAQNPNNPLSEIASDIPLPGPDHPAALATIDTAVPVYDAAMLPQLESLPPEIGVLRLEATEVQLKRAPRALKALRRWVRQGNVLIFHTDAGRLFGFDMNPARPATRSKGGMLFGTSHSMVPLGANPLLGGVSPNNAWGVEKVYYRLQRGDYVSLGNRSSLHLLRNDESKYRFYWNKGTHIVEWGLGGSLAKSVSEFSYIDSTGRNGVTLNYGSFDLASYGHGWLMVLPRTVEDHRGAGALFRHNVQEFLKRLEPKRRKEPQAPLGLPGWALLQVNAEIETLLDNHVPRKEWPERLPLLGDAALRQFSKVCEHALNPPPLPDEDAPRDPNQPLDAIELNWSRQAPLLLTREEVSFARSLLVRLLKTPDDQQLRRRVTALLVLWRARWTWQQAWTWKIRETEQWLEAGRAIAPRCAELAWWRATVMAAGGTEITRPAPEQASWLRSAVDLWQEADTLPSLLTEAKSAKAFIGPGEAYQKRSEGWKEAALARLPVLAAMPPERALQRHFNGVRVIRFARDARGRLPDAYVQHLLKSPLTLHHIDADLGWGTNIEEVLIFNTPEQLAAFHHASGSGAKTMLLWGQSWDVETKNNRVRGETGQSSPFYSSQGSPALGSVDGHRILALRTTELPLSYGDPLAGLSYQRGALRGSTEPPSMARMHGQVLLNALTQDGTPPPQWMKLGLGVLAAQSIMTNRVSWADHILHKGQAIVPSQRIAPHFTEQTSDEALRTLRAYSHFLDLVKNGVDLRSRNADTKVSVIEAQSQRMMRFFYTEFGPGALVETLQRLGSGYSVDEAMFATTGLSEAEFLQVWRSAEAQNMQRLSPGLADPGRFWPKLIPAKPAPDPRKNNPGARQAANLPVNQTPLGVWQRDTRKHLRGQARRVECPG